MHRGAGLTREVAQQAAIGCRKPIARPGRQTQGADQLAPLVAGFPTLARQLGQADGKIDAGEAHLAAGRERQAGSAYCQARARLARFADSVEDVVASGSVNAAIGAQWIELAEQASALLECPGP